MSAFGGKADIVRSGSSIPSKVRSECQKGSRADCATRFWPPPGWRGGVDSISKLMLRKYANAREGGFYGAFRWMFVREGAL